MEHIAPPNTIRQAVVALFSAPSWNVQAIMYSPYYTSFPEKVKRVCADGYPRRSLHSLSLLPTDL